nr:hypothetical protein [Tanacetum cinerariifolium]
MESVISRGQNNTFAEYMILSGADNRPPMLDKDLVIRTKKYAELSAAEKIQADWDMKASNIILQGLPSDIYSLVNHHKVAKDLWEIIQLLMQGDDPIACLNKAMAFLIVVASSRVTVQQVQRRQGQSYSGTGYKSNATSSGGNNSSGQAMTEDLDTYDSDCDDISNAKAVLMANISNYGSDVISEVPHSKTYPNDMKNQSVLAIQDFEQPTTMGLTNNKIHSDSNIILLTEDFGKRFTPQQELSAEQAFWLRMSDPTNKLSDALPIKIEAPKELPKISLVNESLKNLKFHLTKFENVVKIKTTPNARTKEKSKEENINYDIEEIETKNVKLENSVAKLILENERLYNEINHIKQVFKEQFDSIKKIRAHTKEQSDSLIDKLNLKSAKDEDLKAQIQDKVFVRTSLKNDLRRIIRKEIVDIAARKPFVNTIVPGMFKLDLEPIAPRKPKNVKNVGSSKKAKIVESKNANHLEPNHTWGSNATDIPSSSSLVLTGTVRFGNDQIARIRGYGEYQLENVTISRVYYLEGLGHNLFCVGQFCDADLEVSFWKNTCFIRNLEGTVTFENDHIARIIASKTKSWLWHHQLSHLNFGTLKKLAKDGLARGIPRLKFQKDHLCSACALGKIKKSSHQPKAEDTNQEKLYLLHMDLCGPMRVMSINGKMYILAIVDDYSRFTWVRFLRTKDEAPETIVKYIKNIQVRLNATVRNVQTDNRTEFVNQTLYEFYENIGISHQTFIARTPQQNGVVERVSGARFWIKMESLHKLSYETLTRVYLGSYEHYKNVGAEVELLEPGFELDDQEIARWRLVSGVCVVWLEMKQQGDDVASWWPWNVFEVRWVRVLDMQVTLHDKRIVMQVTLHYEFKQNNSP